MELSSEMLVELVKHNVNDSDVVQAARVSTVGERSMVDESKTPAGLIEFLLRERHGSPFEHGSLTFFISAPIFVAREFFRHRAGWSYNEESGRYRELGPKFYIPNRDRNLRQVGKPGAYTFEPGTEAQHTTMWFDMAEAYEHSYGIYQDLLQEGIAKEVARSVLPVGIYTSFYATCNPRSLMHFLSLRTNRKNARVPSFPQREIEMVADQMEVHFRELMPLTSFAFDKYGRVSP